MALDATGQLESIYDYNRPFSENYGGPSHELEAPPAEVLEDALDWHLLGQKIAYPIGVPASPLTASADWIGALARQGFNVLTYKTVRSASREAYPAPNWFFVKDLESPLPVDSIAGDVVVTASGTELPGSRPYSMVNSFGMPSGKPEEWMPDVRRCSEQLHAGQILIVSVVGSYEIYRGDELLADFVAVAKMAEDAGAGAIEVNLSCPNTLADGDGGMGAPLCEDPVHAGEIVQAVRDALRPETKLVAKLGYMRGSQLSNVVERIAGSVDGIAGINTLQVTVVDETGNPAFKGVLGDPERDRPKAGLSGVAIRDLACDFVEQLARLREHNHWAFDIIGMGGVMDTYDVRALLTSGADAVQATSLTANEVGLARHLWEDRRLLEAAINNEEWDFWTVEGLAKELRLAPNLARDLLVSSPDVARRTVLTDREGRELYAARDRRPTLRERIERFRSVL
ncbi:MAG TPA: tRNA-dihydrouridine synthase [Solirubrobacterales bacterium]|nr:tRNA-dihydrouridine synthase [Solirubrobacterales bacterium]